MPKIQNPINPKIKIILFDAVFGNKITIDILNYCGNNFKIALRVQTKFISF
jgi:hypothetical protein